MSVRIFSVVMYSLLVVCSFLLIHITDVQSSYGDACTQNDTSNCTYPVLKCTPAGTCNCSIGLIKDPITNDTGCNMRKMSVPVISTRVSPTSVIFEWEGISPLEAVHYDFVWTPDDGQAAYADFDGGDVSGLKSDCHYNFTIVADLLPEIFNPGGKFFGENIPICTNSPYGGQCDTCKACQDAQLVCMEAIDNSSRCLCGQKFFNLTDTGNCTSLNKLLVTNVTSRSSTTEIILHWTRNIELSFITYIVEWFPNEGELVSVNETGATVSALSPGVSYNFFIVSVLPRDTYYTEKSGTVVDYIAMTQYPHLSKCDVDLSDNCQDTTRCIQAADGSLRCMCGPTDYFSDTSGACSKLEDLQVTDVSETVTAYTVTFTWTAKVLHDRMVNYTLKWTPNEGRLDNISNTGAIVSGLTTETSYDFTIISILPADVYYPEKNVSVQVSSVKTESDLKVTLISAPVSATTVTFTWTGSILTSGVEYRLAWTPNDGQQVYANSSGGRVSGLQPDSEYKFTIVSKLSGKDPFPDRAFIAQEVTICTDSLYGGECSVCGTCQDLQQNCMVAMDTKKRCLCNEQYFNLTNTGNCTNLNELIVTSITTTSSITSVNISWVASLQLSSVTYDINMDENVGHVDRVTRNGGQVSALTPGCLYYFYMVSVVAGDSYNIQKVIYSLQNSFWTDALYLGECDSSINKDCMEMTECTEAIDDRYYCMCDDRYYFNKIKDACSNMDDFKVTNVSITTTSTTVTFMWPAKQLPTLASYTVIWSPNGGSLDVTGTTGAHISNLNSSTIYNFTIIAYLQPDHYYPERRTFVEVPFVKTKPAFNETCDAEVGCQDDQHCLPISGSYRCLCNSTNEYFDVVDQRCLPPSDLAVSLLSTAVSATTVTFRWLGSDPESGVDYNITWTPKGGQKDYANLNGGQVSGLQPDSHYFITIIENSHQTGIFHYGPNVTVCTKSLYGGECVNCGACQDDHQNCVRALDNNTRCLCEESFFNLTETGNCTSLNELIVTNISTSRTTTSVNITWVANLQVSSETYKIRIKPNVGEANRVTSTGGQVLGLSPSAYYYFSVESDLPGNEYENGKKISSPEVGFYTDVYHLGYCDPITNQECLEMTDCKLAQDLLYRCMCDSTYYFNTTTEVCSKLDDLKVTEVSATTTATTVSFTWPAKQLPVTGRFELDWVPSEGRLDNISSTGALVSNLTSATLYNFTIISLLPSDAYYTTKNVSVQVSSVMTKSLFGEQCSTNDSCQDDHQNCLNALDNNTRCLCEDSFFNLTEAGNCTSLNELIVTQITVTASTTSINISWVAGLNLSSVTYKIKLDPMTGQVDRVTSTGGHVSSLPPGHMQYFSVESDLPGNAYENGKSVSSPEILYWTHIPYLKACNSVDPDANQECEDMAECNVAADGLYRCICGSASYFNNQTGVCSSLDDLKVTDISTRTTATTVSFTWSAKQLSSTLRFELQWDPIEGRLDNISSTGALVTNLTTGTVYNFSIMSLLPPDDYYPVKRVSVQVSSVMTKLLYGDQCSTNDSCQDDHQNCSKALDNSTRCLCEESFFNLTETGNCISLNELIVTNITVTASTTSINITWVARLNLSSVTYKIKLDPMIGQVDRVTSTGGHVSSLPPGNMQYFSVESDLPGNAYENGKSVSSSEINYWTDIPYLSVCDPDDPNANQECQETTECIVAADGFYRCICGSKFYFNDTIGVCSTLDDLKVTDVSTRTTATTVSFTWPVKRLPATIRFELEWVPSEGRLDNISSTGAHVTNLTTGTVYNFSIISLLPSDEYYKVKRVSVQISSVMTKNDFTVRLLSTLVSATTVTFLWEKGSPESGVDYAIEWTPKDGHLDDINLSGGQVSDLKPDSLYNFTLLSELSGESFYPEIVYVGPNLTICTDSLYGEHCSTCGTCQDDIQICVPALDSTERCLCDESFFNLTETGNCTLMEELLVTNISITTTTSSVIVTWLPSMQVSSLVYRIQLYPMDGHVDRITSTGGQVSSLPPGIYYNLFVQSVLPQNAYEKEKIVSSSELTFWTDVLHLGLCPPFSSKQCQDKTECNLANDNNYRCTCDPSFYFNVTTDICSSMDDLKVTAVSTRTTATSVSFTWPAKQLPATGRFELEWVPSGGRLDNISSTGALVSNLTSATLYNFTIISLLPSDEYYPDRSISVQISSVMTNTLPESSEHNQAISVGARVGIGIGCVVGIIIIVVVVAVVVYKRRAQISARLQEYSDQEYIPHRDNNESFQKASPSKEEIKHLPSARSGKHRRAPLKPAENMTLESMSQSSQAPQAAARKQEEIAEDSFNHIDTKPLFTLTL